MRMIEEDEVGLKEKPEDTRYIKKMSLLDTRVTLLTLTRVATRLESSQTIYHIYYILQCAKQDKRAAL